MMASSIIPGTEHFHQSPGSFSYITPYGMAQARSPGLHPDRGIELIIYRLSSKFLWLLQGSNLKSENPFVSWVIAPLSLFSLLSSTATARMAGAIACYE